MTGCEPDWTRAQALRWRRERDAARAVLRTAIEELDNWRDKGSAVMRDELVDDFIVAAKKELARDVD